MCSCWLAASHLALFLALLLEALWPRLFLPSHVRPFYTHAYLFWPLPATKAPSQPLPQKHTQPGCCALPFQALPLALLGPRRPCPCIHQLRRRPSYVPRYHPRDPSPQPLVGEEQSFSMAFQLLDKDGDGQLSQAEAWRLLAFVQVSLCFPDMVSMSDRSYVGQVFLSQMWVC